MRFITLRQVKCFFSRTAFIVGIFLVQASQSSMAQKSSLEIGVGLMAFDYAEFDDNNVFIDGETGLIPGVIVKLKTNKRIYYEWEGSVYYNQIEYDGQTQGGTPVKTDSDALIMDTHFKIGLNLNPSFDRGQKLYGGMGYRYWYRNILSGRDINRNPVAGLLEEYRWFYGLLGYEVHFDASNNVKVGFDFRLTKMFNAKMDVDFLGFKGYDNTSVKLGNKVGARLAMPVAIKMRHSSLVVTPFYEIIDIGKSNTVALTRNGNLIDDNSDGFYDGVLEPRSETRNVGVEFIWSW